jgi:hypothetical protein
MTFTSPTPVSNTASISLETLPPHDTDTLKNCIDSDDLDTLQKPSKKPKTKKMEPKTHRNPKIVCNGCNTLLLEAKNLMKNKQPYFYILYLCFDHGQVCKNKMDNVVGVFQYKVSPTVLDATKKLQGLAEKWWKSVSPSQQNSILSEHDKRDGRFYGIFFHHLYPPGSTELDTLTMAFNDNFSMDEAQEFNKFHMDHVTTDEERCNIIELVILFLEDFKFVKQAHQSFESNTNFLSAIGFLAGGKKAQILHRDVSGLPLRQHDHLTPCSLVIPIAEGGRNLYIHGIEEQNYYKIKYGQALCFDGNVLHAGARSKGDPLSHLALHIHIDNKTLFRPPNLLDIEVAHHDEQAWESSGEE